MMAKLVFGACWVSLTSCCPTLWIQVTKTEPSPWPEVPTPAATSPALPTQMQNRFDVLEGGAITRDVEAFRTALDPRDGAIVQRNGIASTTDYLSSKYGLELECQTTLRFPGTLRCASPNGTGAAGHCNFLELPDQPSGDWVLVDGHLRAISGSAGFYDLGVAIDGAGDGKSVDVCFDVGLGDLAKPLLTFVHASDVQLRDPSVVLTDRRLSKRLDFFRPLSSFEYDEDLAFYNQYLFEAVVETINRAAAPGGPEAPSFVIHTGDSIDSNVRSELVRFHQIVDRLQIPFFNVLGNHDVLVFGNLTPTDEAGDKQDRKCTPVAALIGTQSKLVPDKICVDAAVKACASCTKKQVEFVASTEGHAKTRENFIGVHTHDATAPARQFPALTGDYCSKADFPSSPIKRDAFTQDHGFDLLRGADGKPRGYYAFVRPVDDTRNAVFVVLNGEELVDFEGGIYGHVGHDQMMWLRSVLDCVSRQHPKDLVFAFAHQPLSLLHVDAVDRQQNVEEVLRGSRNVVGYLYGHHHENAICRDVRTDARGNRRTCSKFWEVQTASLVEFPQEVRMVKIRQLGRNLGYLEIPTFGESLADQTSQQAQLIRLARRGAERDHCVTHAGRCSDDKRAYRTDGNDLAARLFFRMP